MYFTLGRAHLTSTQPLHTNRETSKKPLHHDLPHPPASSGFDLEGEWDCRTLRDPYRSPQHGDAIFFMWNSLFLYFIDYYSVGPRTGALADKRYVFGVKIRVFLSFVASNQCALTPAICQYFFRRCHPSPHHVSAWFWMRGEGSATVTMLLLAAQRRLVSRYG